MKISQKVGRPSKSIINHIRLSHNKLHFKVYDNIIWIMSATIKLNSELPLRLVRIASINTCESFQIEPYPNLYD
jgi:hypothetical protein